MPRRFLDFQFWVVKVLLTAKGEESRSGRQGRRPDWAAELGCGALASRWVSKSFTSRAADLDSEVASSGEADKMTARYNRSREKTEVQKAGVSRI